jgi:hypothetical protein
VLRRVAKVQYREKPNSSTTQWILFAGHANEEPAVRRQIANFLRAHSKYRVLMIWRMGLVVELGSMYIGCTPDALCLLYDTASKQLVWRIIELKSAVNDSSKTNWSEFVRVQVQQGVFVAGKPFAEA